MNESQQSSFNKFSFGIVPFVLSALACSASAEPSIIVQSTTSTANSGLYDHILPQFKSATGITAHIVAVGTGQAIKNATNCDGDVLLVHAKQAEEAFVAEGFGIERFDLMYNDFVIVGPEGDPASISGTREAETALAAIAEAEALFASRGDDSGTHKKERALWATSGTNIPDGPNPWYRETGSGMGATLNTAVGLAAYTLTDRATWLTFGNKQDFAIAVEGDEDLFNQYGITLVNPSRCPSVNAKAGQALIDWLLSDAGQSAIATFEIGGQQLFFPNAVK